MTRDIKKKIISKEMLFTDDFDESMLDDIDDGSVLTCLKKRPSTSVPIVARLKKRSSTSVPTNPRGEHRASGQENTLRAGEPSGPKRLRA